MGTHEKIHQRIIKKIKLLNPLLWAEESDAISWNRYCKEKLIEAYEEYIKSEERVNKVKTKIKRLRVWCDERSD